MSAVDHDTRLTAQLSDLLGRLRMKEYEQLIGKLDGALRGSAERFVSEVAAHLRHEEEQLFPALREAAPEAAARVDAIEEEHAVFRNYARDLACRIKVHDIEGAFETGRSFLAAIYDHIARETALAREIVGSLSPENARLLESRLAIRT